jgi:metal-responsive CopG/Arc/MetJ family transcriptional regulator
MTASSQPPINLAWSHPHMSIAIRHSYTYTVAMKNITLSVDENILATVRRYAAERNSTVNALVREYLTRIAAHEDRAKRARARLRQLSAQSQGRLGKKTWTREDLHDR